MRFIQESLPNVTEVDVSGCSHTVVLHAVVALSSALLTSSQSDDMEEESDEMEEEEALVDFEKIRSFVASGTPRLIFDPAFVPREDALHTAAKEGWVAWMNFLTRIRVVLDIDQDDDDNRVRVWEMRSVDAHYAAKNGHIAVLELLIAAGADFSDRDPHGYTPLMVAIRSKQAAAAELLVEPTAQAGALDKETEDYSTDDESWGSGTDDLRRPKTPPGRRRPLATRTARKNVIIVKYIKQFKKMGDGICGV
jgi:hypothetical protein